MASGVHDCLVRPQIYGVQNLMKAYYIGPEECMSMVYGCHHDQDLATICSMDSKSALPQYCTPLLPSSSPSDELELKLCTLWPEGMMVRCLQFSIKALIWIKRYLVNIIYYFKVKNLISPSDQSQYLMWSQYIIQIAY